MAACCAGSTRSSHLRHCPTGQPTGGDQYISEINFVSASRQGDIIELGITATEFGRTSITLTCEVRNKITRKSILTVQKWSSSTSAKTDCRRLTGRTEIKYVKDQFQDDGVSE